MKIICFNSVKTILMLQKHLEKTVTTTEFESMHLLKVSNEPKLIAQKHDIVQSLEFLREFQSMTILLVEHLK